MAWLGPVGLGRGRRLRCRHGIGADIGLAGQRVLDHAYVAVGVLVGRVVAQCKGEQLPGLPIASLQRQGVQECRYLVKDFGTSQSPKSTRQRDR
ncbi:MAG: hypothetical protein AB2807_01915 [Candidatus Sedimenticola endophacoides]